MANKYPHIPGNSDAEDKAAWEKSQKKKDKGKDKASSALSAEEQKLNSKVIEMRAADDAAAKAKAEELYAPGSLPRLSAPGTIGAVAAPDKVQQIATENANLNDSIAQSQQRYEETAQRDAYVTDALNRMKEGLAGFNTPELQAMREQGRREIMAQGKNTERSLRQMAGASGLTGQALAAEMRRTNRAVQGDIASQEVDLTVAQAAEQRARLGQYGTFSNDAYAQHQAVRDAALGRLNTQQTAAGEYALSAGKANQTADATNASNAITVGTTNAEIEGKNITNATEAEKLNMGQAEKEKAGYVGIVTGDPAVTEAYRSNLVQKGLSEDAIASANKGVDGMKPNKKDKKKKNK